ncbi:MAG: propionyl-CoA--succinate CoA transferase, partial [Gammaproteobacteria bacterium]|nr:propionyl-CoA--succinate CoA transferase [Gammaproteobacteria bacterium]
MHPPSRARATGPATLEWTADASTPREPAVPDRIRHPGFRDRVASAEQAAAAIGPGMTVAMSGFTGAGYPKAVPQALAARVERANAAGERFRIKVLTGASTAPELDGALAKGEGMELRLPYQSDPAVRERINAGTLDYIDIHLSHVAQHTWFGFFGKIDVAVVEVAGIREDGRLIPSSSVGNNKTWLEQADKVILEVNSWQPAALDGMHDVYYGTALPPDRKPILLERPDDRIGQPYLEVDLDKVVAVVETHAPDRNSAFSPPDEASRQIAGHLID